MSSKLNIIVSGLAGLHPVGGMAWHYLQYVLGFARLGHKVCYHEDTWTWPYDPVRMTNTDRGDYSARFLAGFFERFAPGLRDHWHYLHLHQESFGMSRRKFEDAAREADLFLNISGANFIPEGLNPRCVKLFLDTDPGYNQILLSERFEWCEFADRWFGSVSCHDVHFTFAENIRHPDCLVPKLGWEWKTTRMPVVIDCWEDASMGGCAGLPWTTIMSWNVFKGPVIHRGIEYGDKRDEFAKILELPKRTGVPMKLAVGGKEAPLEALAQHGWTVVDAPSATRSAADYQRFVRASRGEVSIAKQIYVALRTGWFSDRSACYLASGKPVVLQDTGFSRFLPTGEGLLRFDTPEEAIEAIATVEANYTAHAEKAREIACAYFDASKVLSEMLDAAMGSS